jgi:hypothetical protein
MHKHTRPHNQEIQAAMYFKNAFFIFLKEDAKLRADRNSAVSPGSRTTEQEKRDIAERLLTQQSS